MLSQIFELFNVYSLYLHYRVLVSWYPHSMIGILKQRIIPPSLCSSKRTYSPLYTGLPVKLLVLATKTKNVSTLRSRL